MKPGPLLVELVDCFLSSLKNILLDVRNGSSSFVLDTTLKKVRLSVDFAYDYKNPPTIEIVDVHLSSGVPVLPGIPKVDFSGFEIDVISLEPIIGTLTIVWISSSKGPCFSHNHCPLNQYCDSYRGCDDCEICRKLGDTFDRNNCPGKCWEGGIVFKSISFLNVFSWFW